MRKHYDRWETQQRLRLVEIMAWWLGHINRSVLMSFFGYSGSKATADIQTYMTINPGALVYNLNAKRYEASETMGMKLGAPVLEEAFQLLLAGSKPALFDGGPEDPVILPEGSYKNSMIARVPFPARTASPKVLQSAFRAVHRGASLEILYHAVSRNEVMWRKVIPHAFGSDGFRWHLRAWCCERNAFRDFVIGRISDCKNLSQGMDPLPEKDIEWETFQTVTIRPSPWLDEVARKAIEMDYGMTEGKIALRVRKALVLYFRRNLNQLTTLMDSLKTRYSYDDEGLRLSDRSMRIVDHLSSYDPAPSVESSTPSAGSKEMLSITIE